VSLVLHKGYRPGCIGAITALHAHFYSAEKGFGQVFESRVARELASFSDRYSGSSDGLWLALIDGRVHGSIVIDGTSADDEGAHLRWFITSDQLRGTGCGRTLLSNALSFCDTKLFPSVYLNTFQGLDAARHLYEAYGFQLVEQSMGTQWGFEVNEQRFVRRLAEQSNKA
jgi:GNAT superfamily N-acetyltransferase